MLELPCRRKTVEAEHGNIFVLLLSVELLSVSSPIHSGYYDDFYSRGHLKFCSYFHFFHVPYDNGVHFPK